MTTTVICMMGPACAGKSTTISRAMEMFPDDFAAVEVGKALRAKYGDGYFKGLGNPQHTAQEAWNLCEVGVDKHITNKKLAVFVDGQPRDIPQIDLMLSRFPEAEIKFVLLTCDEAEQHRRAALSRTGDSLELAKARITNDCVMYYRVISKLLLLGHYIDVVDTTTDFNADVLIKRLHMQAMDLES